MSTVRPARRPHPRQALDAETKTASGLFLPESAKERPMQGKVVADRPRQAARQRRARSP
jgi:co-chaperonin GroES (HSP10)